MNSAIFSAMWAVAIILSTIMLPLSVWQLSVDHPNPIVIGVVRDLLLIVVALWIGVACAWWVARP